MLTANYMCHITEILLKVVLKHNNPNPSYTCRPYIYIYNQGWIQDFKLGRGGGGGAYFKKLRRAEGGAKTFGVFRVENHHFTQKNHIFSNFRGERAGCAPPPPPWILPWFRSCGLQNPPPTPSTRPSMKNLKIIVDNYNVFQVHYIV